MDRKEVCILQKGDEVVLRCFMQCINCSHCPLGNKTRFFFVSFNNHHFFHSPPLMDADVLDHPGINQCILNIFDIFDICTNNYNTCSFTIFNVFDICINNYNTCIFRIFDIFDMKCMYFILFTTKKGSPWDTEFRCPLVMSDLSQCLGSRVPPLHSTPALYNHGVSWY